MSQQTLTVARVDLCTRITGQQKCINLITFQNGPALYVAEEVTDYPSHSPGSQFVIGLPATFEITNRGLPGKKDWIRYVPNGYGEVNMRDYAQINMKDYDNGQVVTGPSKDKLIVAQVAFKAAVDLVVASGGDRADVLPMATEFAHDIFKIASEL